MAWSKESFWVEGKARLAFGDGSPCVIAVLDRQRACPGDAEGVFWGRRALSIGVGVLLSTHNKQNLFNILFLNIIIV